MPDDFAEIEDQLLERLKKQQEDNKKCVCTCSCSKCDPPPTKKNRTYIPPVSLF